MACPYSLGSPLLSSHGLGAWGDFLAFLEVEIYLSFLHQPANVPDLKFTQAPGPCVHPLLLEFAFSEMQAQVSVEFAFFFSLVVDLESWSVFKYCSDQIIIIMSIGFRMKRADPEFCPHCGPTV